MDASCGGRLPAGSWRIGGVPSGSITACSSNVAAGSRMERIEDKD
eukprot:CAMPEP_0172363592 /NCGR_PEP_ID=MMETSP1060-20121228/6904_1 /TAXON_ID=37318 /ORGANISM="Pseudo-nitzschia pungens, Strain cf. cingulata" /LENGTH=44 /DNA_ID= /DNA_START= /DNA_END= /DNA_ORIENTATION=